MSISQEYKKIYAEEIISKCKGVIFRYSPVKNKYDFLPFSHGVGCDAVEKLAEIMRKNLLFYCYGEEEIVSDYARSKFSSLEQAAKYAFKHRLPDRAHTNDGLPSEVLLDLLIQITEPMAYKLAVRPIFRQDDNNEIKGYDLTYFSILNNEVSLWLGQAKMGAKEYCKGSINQDLLEKFKTTYLAKSRVSKYNVAFNGGMTETVPSVVRGRKPGCIDMRFEQTATRQIATDKHHIFPAAEFPKISTYYENIICITPEQHYTWAHPDHDTHSINQLYQYYLVLSKMEQIMLNIQDNVGTPGFYSFRKFTEVLDTGLSTDEFGQVPNNDFDRVSDLIDHYY